MRRISVARGAVPKSSGPLWLSLVTASALGCLPSPAASQAARPYQAYGAAYDSTAEGLPAGRTFDPGPALIEKIEPDVFFAEMSASGFGLPATRPSGPAAVPTREGLKTARKERVLAHAATKLASQYIEVVVELEGLPFAEIRELRSMETEARRQVLENREALVRADQRDFVDHARNHGALVLDSLWLLNRLRVMLPARRASKILEHYDVQDVYPAWPRATADWDGLEIREQTFLKSEFYDRQVRGELGGRSFQSSLGEDNIKIAIVESPVKKGVLFQPNFLNDTHPGWIDYPGWPSRVVWNVDCLDEDPDDGVPKYCETVLPGSHDVASHGTVVSWIAAGGIHQGQDPDCVSTGNCSPTAEEMRTGVAPEAALFYFRTGTAGEIHSALQLAFIGGADVANLSITFDPEQTDACGDYCEAWTDCGGLNAMIRTVTDGGMLVVTSAGNANNEIPYPAETNCNIGYPGSRPELIVAGGIGNHPDVDPLEPYETEPIGDYSSRGFMPAFVGGSHVSLSQMPIVSITAPGVMFLHFVNDDYYSPNSVDPFWRHEVAGTSFSAPIISAAAGLFRERMGSILDDARMLKALVLLMGDGTDAPYAPPGLAEGISEVYGTGKFKAHDIHSLEGPAEWLLAQDTIEEGESMSRRLPAGGTPLPAGVSQLKFVAYIDNPDLATAPFVFVHVVDPCNGNIGLGYDWNFALVKYISIEASRLPPGACPDLRAWGYSIPPGGVDVYFAAYYHGGDPADH